MRIHLLVKHHNTICEELRQSFHNKLCFVFGSVFNLLLRRELTVTDPSPTFFTSLICSSAKSKIFLESMTVLFQLLFGFYETERRCQHLPSRTCRASNSYRDARTIYCTLNVQTPTPFSIRRNSRRRTRTSRSRSGNPCS